MTSFLPLGGLNRSFLDPHTGTRWYQMYTPIFFTDKSQRCGCYTTCCCKMICLYSWRCVMWSAGCVWYTFNLFSNIKITSQPGYFTYNRILWFCFFSSRVCIAFLLHHIPRCTSTQEEVLSLPPSCDTSYPVPCPSCCTFTLVCIGGEFPPGPEFRIGLCSWRAFLRVLCFSTETIPFSPGDVTSTFGPLVGAWALYSSKPQDVLLGVGVGQKRRRCNRTRELCALNGGGYRSWTGGPMDTGPPFWILFAPFRHNLNTSCASEWRIYTLDLFLSSAPFDG